MARHGMTTENRPTFITMDEAAELLGVSSRTIRRRVADGSLPAYRTGPPGSRVRLRVDELLGWLEGPEDSA